MYGVPYSVGPQQSECWLLTHYRTAYDRHYKAYADFEQVSHLQQEAHSGSFHFITFYTLPPGRSLTDRRKNLQRSYIILRLRPASGKQTYHRNTGYRETAIPYYGNLFYHSASLAVSISLTNVRPTRSPPPYLADPETGTPWKSSVVA